MIYDSTFLILISIFGETISFSAIFESMNEETPIEYNSKQYNVLNVCRYVYNNNFKHVVMVV